MNKDALKGRIAEIVKLLKKQYPGARIALNFGDHFQLLVAVILSAQCTDERVNLVTPALFKRFPHVADYAECKLAELEKLIYSTGFYKNKAKNIKAAAEKIVSVFEGKMPRRMDDLLSLPGVARKSANVILHAAFGKVFGIVVDTHVARLCGRLGLVNMELSKAKNAVRIEQELMVLVPRKEWSSFAHLLIAHGRHVCKAKKPDCKGCLLNNVCPSAFKV